MLRFRPAVPFAALALSLSALTAQQGQRAAAPCVQDLLPASSYFAISFAGLDRCSEAVAANAVARVLQEFRERIPKATYDQHVAPALSQAVEELRAGLGEAGLPPATLRSLLRGPMAFGVGRLTIKGMGPSVALLLADYDGLEAAVDSVWSLAQQLDDGFERSETKVGDLACRKLTHREGPTALMARVGHALVITNSEGYLLEIAATQRGQQPSLATASSLGRSRAQVGDRPLCEAYLHTQPLVAMFDPCLPYEAAQFGEAFGVQSLDGVYAAVAESVGGTVETFDLGVRGPTHGMLKAAFAGPCDFGAAAFCSKDTLAFATARCDVPATFKGWQTLLGALPDAARQEIERDLARDLGRELRGLGVTPEQLQELFNAISGSVSIGVSLQKAVPLPEVLLLAPVRNRAVVDGWLQRLMAMSQEQAGIQWAPQEVDGVTLHTFQLPRDGAPIPMPLSPTIALFDGWLLVGSDDRVVKAALAQRKDQASSLLAADDFALAMRDNGDAALLVHARPGHGLELAWRLLETQVLKQLDAHADEIGFGSEALPDREDLVQAAGAVTFSVTVDQAGVRARTRGNFGLGGLLIGGAALVDDLLQQAAGKIY